MDETWASQTNRIDNQIRLLQATTQPRLDEARATFELLNRAPELYDRQNAQEKAQVLRELVSSSAMSGSSFDPVYKKPFDAVAIGLRTGDWYARGDS